MSKFRIFCAAALVGLVAVAATAETRTLTVRAGDHDRMNTPVCVALDLPEETQSAVLTDTDGNELAAQLTAPGLLGDAGKRELHFIVPELEQGQSMELTATFSSDPPDAAGFAWEESPGQIELRYAGRPVLRYMCKPYDADNREETYKVFHHVFDPAGTRLVTKGPGGKFTHHRGVFYGFNRVTYGDGKRADVWHCGGQAHQSHEGVLSEEAGPVLGRHRVAVDWHGQGEVFAQEKRELTVYRTPGGHLIEFASRLVPTGGKVKLDGDPQHAGFQFRAAQEVAAENQKLTYYLRPDGKGKPGGTRNWSSGKDECANLPFNAMSFVVGGQRYTAVYVDHPDNPKPARYSERSYGRFGSYFVKELEEGEELAINYRLWLQDGEMTVDEAADFRADFVRPVESTIAK